MQNFDQQTLNDLKQLCRIQCTPEEEKELLVSLGKILDYIQQLNEIDTSQIPANVFHKKTYHDAMRDDSVNDLLSREQYLANVSDQIEGMIRVPPVFKIT